MFVRAGVGLGAANCPSLQQLTGVVDLTDPCQAQVSASGDTVVSAGGPVGTPPTCMPGDVLTVQNGYYICQQGGPLDSAIAFVKNNALLIGGGLALVLLVNSMGGGRRRR